MYQLSGSTQAALDYNSTIIGALDLSEKKWVLAVQLPDVSRHSRHVLEARGDGLASFVERLKARCAAAGRKIARVILTHEDQRQRKLPARGSHQKEIHTRDFCILLRCSGHRHGQQGRLPFVERTPELVGVVWESPPAVLSAIAVALPRWAIASWKAERRSAWSPARPHHSIARSSRPASVK